MSRRDASQCHILIKVLVHVMWLSLRISNTASVKRTYFLVLYSNLFRIRVAAKTTWWSNESGIL